ncbi:arylsulfotransferase family protein [Streptomyces sp. 4N509B]|uniref:arylsulfotransferase family protein n=1 Tax=Streptomyces sp. 4N509B TaxID=3457413 RepID=UPI003FD4D60D
MLCSVALVVPFTPAAGAAPSTPHPGPDPGPRSAPDSSPHSAPPEATPALGTGPYLSRPELRQAPELTTSPTGREDPGLLLTTPYGAGSVIYDNAGEPVWFGQGSHTNLQQILYDGEPALAVLDTDADGSRAVVLDASYTEVASFAMDGGRDADFHSLAFSADGGRVLMTSLVPGPYDLSEHGGLATAEVVDVLVQEIDTATGEVTFEWRGLDHVPVEETHEPLTGEQVDYLHTNSVAYDTDGDILMSARHTSTIYKIDTDSGEVVWRFGGENGDFTFADPGDAPSHQHDASRLPDGRLVAFDNGVGRVPEESRGAVWELDERAMTADLVRDLRPEEPIFAEFTGSHQPTANGNHLVSFGDTGTMVEFDGAGPVFTATFDGTATYRATRSTDWVGTPAAPPDVAWRRADPGAEAYEVFMSWNGATEVERWRVEARSADGGAFRELRTVDRSGFETTTRVTADAGGVVLRVSALDDDGRVLGSRTLTEPPDPATP